MIHPDLSHDPLIRQGHIGIISTLSDDRASAYIRFPNQIYGRYDTAALLMLVPGFALVDKLRCLPFDDLAADELIDLMEIALLDASDDPNHQFKALELATDNPNLCRAAILSVDDWIEGFMPDLDDMVQGPGRNR